MSDTFVEPLLMSTVLNVDVPLCRPIYSVEFKKKLVSSVTESKQAVPSRTEIALPCCTNF